MEEDRDWRERLRDEGPEPDDADPHRSLANPAEDPDPTEWPDPYDKREDPRDEPDGDGGRRAEPGATSTSEPHPREDPEATRANAPEYDRPSRPPR